MGKAIDLTGQRFTRLTAIEPTKRRVSHRCVVWKCLCDCGNICFVSSLNLRTGHTQSCGCLKNSAHGMSILNEWDIWYKMIDRCENPKNISYENYGGRGIKVCARWHKFENFLTDVGKRPKGKSLDRWPDNDGDYKPDNWRWATPHEQRVNSRPKSYGRQRQRWFFAYNENTGEWDEDNNQSEFARNHGLNSAHISACLHKKEKAHKGWTFEFLT